MKIDNQSIFEKYYSEEKFLDRYLKEDDGVDVIIPLINTNELWEKNLISFYREIPINNLLIGDGGCTDDSITIVKKFPRVKVLNQSSYESQGFCIKELIENVNTDWFIYLHADVYLPSNWYDEMKKHQKDFAWFECYRKKTSLIEYWSHRQHKKERAFSGSQMGKKEAFDKILHIIDDDYLQRNEDIILHELIENAGYKYGRIPDTFHYHQIMDREGAVSSCGKKEPGFKKISVVKERKEDWEKKISEKQAKGIIKYLSPDKKYLVSIVNSSLFELEKLNALNRKDFIRWVEETNPEWLNYIFKDVYLKRKIFNLFKKIVKIVKRYGGG